MGGPILNTIFFHEDDHSQIELLPKQNKKFCVAQIDSIEANQAPSKKHSASRTDDKTYAPVELKSLKLSFKELDSDLSSKLNKFDKVFTGYGKTSVECASVYAYGSEKNGIIFVECSNNGTVSSIWFSDSLLVLPNIFRKRNLIFVDWAWLFICDVEDDESYANYVNDKNEVMKNRSKVLKGKFNAQRYKPWWHFW